MRFQYAVVQHKSNLRLRCSNYLCCSLLISIVFCQINFAIAQNFQCNGEYTLSNTTGHITDHIGAETYQESVTCYWYLQFNNTSNDTYITIIFNSFELELDWDYLNVYETNNTVPLAMLTGYDIPHPIMTKTSNITIQFQSDPLIVLRGFDLNYYLARCPSRCHNNGYCIADTCHCDEGWTGPDCSIKAGCSSNLDCGGTQGWCTSTDYCDCKPGFYGPTCQLEYCEDITLLTFPSGSFSSHLTQGEYLTNQHCIWIIDPASRIDPADQVDTITLQVNYFYTGGGDSVTVYGNDIRDVPNENLYPGYIYSDANYDSYVRDSENVIMTLAGVYQYDTIIVSQSGRMVVDFSSDLVATRPGFQFTYTSCLKSQCNFTGYCYRNSCLCDPGFTGPSCTSFAVWCPNNCSSHGDCVNIPDQYALEQCYCDPEWTGVDCNVALNVQTNTYPVVAYSPYLSTVQITADSTPTYLECRYSASITYNISIPMGITSGSFLGISSTYTATNPMPNADITIFVNSAFNIIPGNILLRFTYLNLTLNDTLTVYNGLSTSSPKLAEMDETTTLNRVYPIVAKQPIAIVLKRNLTNYDSSFIDSSIPFQIYFEISRCMNGCLSGECVLGICQCYPGWSGDMCQSRTCERNCSGNGICLDGSCQCFPGYSGGVCQSPTCRGNVTITNFTTAVVSDHVIGYHYWPSVLCGFLFQGPINSTLSMFFSTQQIQPFMDTLVLYDGPSRQSPLVFTSDNSVLPLPHKSQGGDLFLSFRTDSRTQYSGWTATVYANQLCGTSCMNSSNALCYSTDFDAPNPNLPTQCLCDGPSCITPQNIISIVPSTIYQISLPDYNWLYFKYYVDKPAGELSINFTRGYNQPGFPFPELYIKFGSLPSHDSYDIYRTYLNDQSTPNSTLIRFPNPSIGTYYIGIYSRKIEGRSNNTFVISAKASCPIGCTQNGVCDQNNMCRCWDNLCWSGYDCNTAVQNCSGFGTCLNGVCNCSDGFAGNNCEKPICNPLCINGQCKPGSGGGPNWCDCSGTPYGGDQCQTWLNLTCTPECQHSGICVGTNAPCDCSETGGYFGLRCEQFACTDVCEFGECVAPDVCLCYYGATQQGCNPAPINASAFVLTVVAVVIGVFACVVVLTTVILIVKLVKATTVVRPIIGQAGADERTMK